MRERGRARAQFFGLLHFDHLGGALLALAQYTVPDSAYDPLHFALESEPQAAGLTLVLFLSFTCINTFIMLGLVLAVITGTFRDNSLDPPAGAPGSVASSGSGVEEVVEPAIWSSAVLRNSCWIALVHSTILFQSGCILALTQYLDKSHLSISVMIVVCNSVFVVELFLRLKTSPSASSFVGNLFHIFEMIMILSSLTGVAFERPFLVLIPLLRFYRLTVYSPTINAMLQTLISTKNTFGQLIFFIWLSFLAFSVLARYYFRAAMEQYTRSHFSNIGQGMLTTFQLFTGDQWSLVMYTAIASKDTAAGQLLSGILIVSWLFISRIILYDLFVVILMDNFKVTDTIELIQMPGRVDSVKLHIKKSFASAFHHLAARKNRRRVANEEVRTQVPEEQAVSHTSQLKHSNSFFQLMQFTNSQRNTMMLSIHDDLRSKVLQHLLQQAYSIQFHERIEGKSDGPEKAGCMTAAVVNHPKEMVGEEYLSKEQSASAQTTLFIFGHGNIIRRFCIYMQKHPIFISLVYGSIFCSCFLLAATPPAPDVPGQNALFSQQFSDVSDAVFTGIFTTEMLINIVAQVIDCIIVVFALLDQCGILGSGVSKIFRLFRALRPLRLIKRNRSLRVLMEALLCTLPPVLYLLGFSLLIYTSFTILGKGLFAGRMFRCSFGAEFPEGKTECAGLHVDQTLQILYPRSWYTPRHNFDTIYQASLTIFRIQTLKYVDIMRDCMDITSVNVSPAVNYSPWNSLFFIICIFIGPVVIMNLFIAQQVEIDRRYENFNRYIQAMTPNQIPIKLPSYRLSQAARFVIGTTGFKTFSSICVVMNICFLLSDHADASDSFGRALATQNAVFFWELVFEVVLGIVGFGFKGFFMNRWRVLDFLIMLGSAVGYISISRTVETISKVYSMFATLFVQVFGITKYGKRIGDTANFESFTSALLTIYQMVIGDEWMQIMDDAEIDWPECTPKFDSTYIYNYTGQSYSFGDCGSAYSRYIFVVFKLICECIFLNLFIGVVLENFSFITEEASANEDVDWKSGPSRRQIKELAAVFCRFSRSTEYMPLGSAVNGFILAIPPPLGLQVPIGGDGAHDLMAVRMLLRLIRAELNLALRRRAARSTLAAPGGFAAIRHCSILAALTGGDIARQGTRCLFANGVSFREVLTALALWRNPSMIPTDVQRAHRESMPDVVRTACALVICDFLRGAAARRHRLGQVAAGLPRRHAAGPPAAKTPQPAAVHRAGTAVPVVEEGADALRDGPTRRLAALPQRSGWPARADPYRVDAALKPAPAAGRPRRLRALRPLAGLPGALLRPVQGEEDFPPEERWIEPAAPSAGHSSAAFSGPGADSQVVVAAAEAAAAAAAAARQGRRVCLRPLPGGGPGRAPCTESGLGAGQR